MWIYEICVWNKPAYVVALWCIAGRFCAVLGTRHTEILSQAVPFCLLLVANSRLVAELWWYHELCFTNDILHYLFFIRVAVRPGVLIDKIWSVLP